MSLYQRATQPTRPNYEGVLSFTQPVSRAVMDAAAGRERKAAREAAERELALEQQLELDLLRDKEELIFKKEQQRARRAEHSKQLRAQMDETAQRQAEGM